MSDGESETNRRESIDAENPLRSGPVPVPVPFRAHQKVIPLSCGVTSGLHGCCQYLEVLFGPVPHPMRFRPGHSGRSLGGHATTPAGHS